MPRPRALDLFCCAGGVSEGLRRAGFDVTGVDINPDCEEYYGGEEFICADALTFPLKGFDFIWASPPCQAHTVLRHVTKKEYPDFIPAVLERFSTLSVPWCVENVVGAPLDSNLMLCASMFDGLTTPDGRAELRRHRLFKTTFFVPQPKCRHRRRAISVIGNNAESHPLPRNQKRKTYSIDIAQCAMGIDWMPMRFLSQAIPPRYSQYIGRFALRALNRGRFAS